MQARRKASAGIWCERLAPLAGQRTVTKYSSRDSSNLPSLKLR